MQSKTFDKIDSVADLKRLQRAFADVIRRPLQLDDAMAADRRSDAIVVPNETLSPHQRLELYAQQYWWRIRDSLYEDFSGVRNILGDTCFIKVANAYLVKYPSRSFTLRNLGDRFPRFLRGSRDVPSSLRQLAFETATVEWDKIEVFDAVSGQPLTATSSARTKIVLSPALRLRSLRYPAHSVFVGQKSAGSDHEQTSNMLANNNADVTVSKPKRLKRFSVRKRSTYLATHRYRGQVYFKELTKDEFNLLRLIEKSNSITTALRKWRPSKAKISNLEVTVAAMFQEWGSLGWLCAKRSS